MDWQEPESDRQPRCETAASEAEVPVAGITTGHASPSASPVEGLAPAAAPLQSQAIGFIPRITVGALVESEPVAEAMRSASRDRRMSRAVCDIARGSVATAAEHFRDAAVPDLIVVESRLEPDGLLQALENLAAECPPGTRLIVIGHENDVALYRRLIRFGVGDYLVAPVEPLAVVEAVAQLFREGDPERLGKVTAFIGARGGAGSSAVAQNTAAAMARGCETSVLLMDLDLAFGSAALDLNLETAQGVRDALEQGERLDAALLDRLVTARDDRIGILAAPCALGRDQEPDPQEVEHLIDTARAVTPHLLIDLPCCWTGWVRKALLAADEVVLTAAPDLVSLRNARNIVRVVRTSRVNDPDPRLVLNGVGMAKRREVGAADYERVLELPPTAVIRHDPAAFAAAAASGALLVETGGTPEAAAAFDRLARIITGQKQPDRPRRGLGGLARLMRRTT